MSDLLSSIRAVASAADGLTLACANHNAIVPQGSTPGISRALRKAYRTTFVTPFDMTAALRKMK